MDDLIRSLCIRLASTGHSVTQKQVGRRALLGKTIGSSIVVIIGALLHVSEPAFAHPDCSCTVCYTNGCGYDGPCNITDFGCSSTCGQYSYEASETICYDCGTPSWKCSDTGCVVSLQTFGCCPSCG